MIQDIMWRLRKNIGATILGCIVVLAAVTQATNSYAHTTGETYVWFNVEASKITGRVEINLNDLREKLDVPVPGFAGDRLAVLEDYRTKAGHRWC